MTSAGPHAPTAGDATLAGADRSIDRRDAIALGIIVLIGAGLRFAFLDGQSLWIDEVFHWDAARSIGAEGLLGVARRDIVAPLSHLVLWLSTLVLGTSDVALRVPSALAGTAAIPLVFLLGRRWLSTDAGLVAAALAALSPFAIWHAQDVRAYPLVLCMICLVLLAFHAAVLRSGRGRTWVALTVATTAALYTHQYVAALLMSAVGVFMVVAIRPWRALFWKWLATQVIAVVLFAPWLVMALRLLSDQTPGTEKAGSLLWAPYAGFCYLFGYSLGPSVRELHGGAFEALGPHLPLLAVLGIASAWLVIAACVRLWRSGQRTVLLLALTCIAGPLVLAMVAPLFTSISFNARYTTAAVPPLFVLLGAVVYGRRPGVLTALAGAVVAAGMLWSTANHLTNAHYAKADLRAAAAHLNERLQPGDVVIISSATAAGPLKHYAFVPTTSTIFVGPGPTIVRRVEPAPGAAATYEPQPGPVADTLPRALAGAAPPSGRVWLLESRPWESDEAHEVAAVLATLGTLDTEARWPGVTLARWTVSLP